MVCVVVCVAFCVAFLVAFCVFYVEAFLNVSLYVVLDSPTDDFCCIAWLFLRVFLPVVF